MPSSIENGGKLQEILARTNEKDGYRIERQEGVNDNKV